MMQTTRRESFSAPSNFRRLKTPPQSRPSLCAGSIDDSRWRVLRAGATSNPMSRAGWEIASVLAIFGALALGALTWFAIAALIEVRATARELRESLRRLTPLAEDTLRQTRNLTETAANEVAGFAHWRQTAFANVASGFSTVLSLARALFLPSTPRSEPEHTPARRSDT